MSEARAFVSSSLNRWGLESLVDDAQLLTSELVTNAVLHALSDVTVTVAVADGTAEVGVADSSDDLPRTTPAGADADAHAEGGRGLRLVESVAGEWGVAQLEDGKQVWFQLDVGPGWEHRTSCPCGGDELSRVRLQSGRWAVAAPGPWDEVRPEPDQAGAGQSRSSYSDQ